VTRSYRVSAASLGCRYSMLCKSEVFHEMYVWRKDTERYDYTSTVCM